MKQTADYAFDYEGSSMYLRVWESENGQENPVVLVEPGRGIDISQNRSGLANELATAMDVKPEDIRWYEMDARGKMTQIEFEPYEREHRPYENDMSLSEIREVRQTGDIEPDILKGYNQIEKGVSQEQKEELTNIVGEKILTYEQRDWEQLQAPKMNLEPDIER